MSANAQPMKLNVSGPLADFDAAMRKLVAVPKGVIEKREREWQAAKKKAAKKR